MSRFKFYREWRGGCWVFTHFINWTKVDNKIFTKIKDDRQGSPEWSFECYTE
jgi:hypothetical protein